MKSILSKRMSSAAMGLMAFTVTMGATITVKAAEEFAGKQVTRADGAQVEVSTTMCTLRDPFTKALGNLIDCDNFFNTSKPSSRAQFFWRSTAPVSYSIGNALQSMKQLIDAKEISPSALDMPSEVRYRIYVAVRGTTLLERGTYTIDAAWTGPIGSLESSMCYAQIARDGLDETMTTVGSLENYTAATNRWDVPGGPTALFYVLSCSVNPESKSTLFKQMFAAKPRFTITSEKTGKPVPITFENLNNGLSE